MYLESPLYLEAKKNSVWKKLVLNLPERLNKNCVSKLVTVYKCIENFHIEIIPRVTTIQSSIQQSRV